MTLKAEKLISEFNTDSKIETRYKKITIGIYDFYICDDNSVYYEDGVEDHACEHMDQAAYIAGIENEYQDLYPEGLLFDYEIR